MKAKFKKIVHGVALAHVGVLAKVLVEVLVVVVVQVLVVVVARVHVLIHAMLDLDIDGRNTMHQYTLLKEVY